MFILSPAIALPIASETVTINVIPLSRYGRNVDVAHIQNFIHLREPLAQPQKFLIPDVGTDTAPKVTLPGGEAIKLDVIDAGAVDVIKNELLRQVQEFLSSPEAGEMQQVQEIMSSIFGLSMVTSEREIPAGTQVINFSYTKEIPIINNVATLETMVPLASFTAQNGSRLQCTIVLPFDPPVQNPQGVWQRPDGSSANLSVIGLEGGRYALSAFWQNDPALRITYNY